MKLKSAALLCLSAAIALTPVSALSWKAWNRHEVQPLGNGVYEVISEIGSGPVQFWCAIGDYATRKLRAGSTDRIYVWKPVGPSVTRSGRKGVQFSLTAPAGANTAPGYSLSVKHAGDNISVAMAHNYCYDSLALENPLLRG